MAEPFLSEIRLMSFAFPPKGWAECNGQLLPLNQNQGLFSLLGTTYGGDGVRTFGLPDLRGRVPIHTGAGHTLGERGGEVDHTLTATELPDHFHQLFVANGIGTRETPTATSLPALPEVDAYVPSSGGLRGSSTLPFTPAGGGQAHTNLQPFLTLVFCIALQGIFPSPT